MCNVKYLVIILFVTIILVSCRKLEYGVPLNSDNPWIGLWQNSKDVIEIRQNGTGRWVTNEGLENPSPFRSYTLEDKFDDGVVYLEGLVLIEDNQLKIGIYEKDKHKKIFSIDEHPTETLNNSGDVYTFVILNQDTLINWY